MQIGVMNHPARDPIAEIHWIGSNGFEFVDFTLEPPAADPDVIDPKAIRDALAEHGLGVVAHTAWFIPLGSPYAGIREASLQEFRRCLKSAHAIGATVMNAHYRPVPPACSTQQIIHWHVETLQPLCAEAAELGITIVLEHVPEGSWRQLENIQEIMELVPRLRFHLDSGHAKLESRHDRFDEYLEKLGHKLLHVHLSTTTGLPTSTCRREPCPAAAPTGRSTSGSSRPPGTTAPSRLKCSRRRTSTCCSAAICCGAGGTRRDECPSRGTRG